MCSGMKHPRPCSWSPLFAFSVLFALALAACGSDAPDLAAPAPEASYHRDASALFSRYCTDCHRAGGVAPFALVAEPGR